MPSWELLYNFISHDAWATVGVVVALLTASLTAFAREQIRDGTEWLLGPLARHLPWNRGGQEPVVPNYLTSVLTLVQVFIDDAAGKRARYEKTTSFIVNSPTASYQEAVTAEHAATSFATMRGAIVETVVEHGFNVSTIDLGDTLEKGERFTNVYSAVLIDSFGHPQEHWTQEFTHPTEHFTLLVHFPAARPPKFVSCSILDGSDDKPVAAGSGARLDDLFGRKSIVWEVANPDPSQILKLAWGW